jgi:hypothetical protein
VPTCTVNSTTKNPFPADAAGCAGVLPDTGSKPSPVAGVAQLVARPF